MRYLPVSTTSTCYPEAQYGEARGTVVETLSRVLRDPSAEEMGASAVLGRSKSRAWCLLRGTSFRFNDSSDGAFAGTWASAEAVAGKG